MNTYIVYGEATISCYTYVEANSEDEAMDIARVRPVGPFWLEAEEAMEEWTADELDGDPTIIGVEVK